MVYNQSKSWRFEIGYKPYHILKQYSGCAGRRYRPPWFEEGQICRRASTAKIQDRHGSNKKKHAKQNVYGRYRYDTTCPIYNTKTSASKAQRIFYDQPTLSIYGPGKLFS